MQVMTLSCFCRSAIYLNETKTDSIQNLQGSVTGSNCEHVEYNTDVDSLRNEKECFSCKARNLSDLYLLKIENVLGRIKKA